jgi:uncharacterized delta-60 repeat protein
MKMFQRITFLIPLLLVMMSGIMYAAPGDLDTTFNPPNGVVTYDGGSGDDYCFAMAIQSDGKIVVAGRVHDGTNADLLVLRYNVNGSLDDSFGTNGVVTYGGKISAYGIAVAIQSDGKIVVAGHAEAREVLVLRYNPDGSPDSSFGTNGVATYESGYANYGWAVAIDSDGKIVVAGAIGTIPDKHVLVLRYNADGALDNSFGANGVVTYDGGGGDDYAEEVAIQSDGKIVVSGDTDNDLDYEVLVLRFNTDGTRDNGFGTNGVVTYDGGSGDDSGLSVAIQSDGKIVVAGYTDNGLDYDVLVLRFNTDGTRDNGFGTNGVATYDGGSGLDHAEPVAIQSDGRIVVGGDSDNGSDRDVLVLRLIGGESGSTPPSRDDDDCFIATAAYGSSIDPHVNVLREFRDRFLLNNPMGRAFVDLYYEYSPSLADIIATHSSLRGAMRWILLPLIGLSWIVMHLGPTATVSLMVLLTVMISAIGVTYVRRLRAAAIPAFLVLCSFFIVGQAMAAPGDVVHTLPDPLGIPLRGGVEHDGNYLWVSTERPPYGDGRVYKIDPSDGSIITSYGQPHITVVGLAYDHVNNVIYNEAYPCGPIDVVDAETFVTLGSFPAPACWIHDITYDGTYLWAVTGDSITPNYNVYKLDPSNGAVLAQFWVSAPDNPGGITWDGEHLWIIWGDGLYHQIDQERALQDGSTDNAVLNQFSSISGGGLAFDGEFIWVTTGHSDIHKIQIADPPDDDTDPPEDCGKVDGKADYPCFIATAAYGSALSKKVNIFRQLRDRYLLTNELGGALVSVYYKYSPPLADCIAKHPMLRKIARIGLYPILELSRWLVGENNSEEASEKT